jgi:hypothetical protein
MWTYSIETVAKSERGFDRTTQGTSVTLRWKLETGGAKVEVQAARRLEESKTEPETSAGVIP